MTMTYPARPGTAPALEHGSGDLFTAPVFQSGMINETLGGNVPSRGAPAAGGRGVAFSAGRFRLTPS
jgi:hypothetical protein